jgi:hypothetical protein
LSSIADQNPNEITIKIEDPKLEEREKPYTNKNIYDQGSIALKEIGIFEISNNQMF